MLRLELLTVKADLERELGRLVLHCSACGLEVHWVQGVSMSDPGHWGHCFAAPHGEPSLDRFARMLAADRSRREVMAWAKRWRVEKPWR